MLEMSGQLVSKLYCLLLDTDLPRLLLPQLTLQQLIPLHHGMHGQGLRLSHQGLHLVGIDLYIIDEPDVIDLSSLTCKIVAAICSFPWLGTLAIMPGVTFSSYLDTYWQ